jgi:hypothetical protein
VLFYSLPSFLSAGIFGGSTAKNMKKHLCVLRVSAVKTIGFFRLVRVGETMDLHAEVKRLRTQLKKSGARPKDDRGKDERTFFNKDFGSLMPSLSLTLNVEPVNGYVYLSC